MNNSLQRSRRRHSWSWPSAVAAAASILLVVAPAATSAAPSGATERAKPPKQRVTICHATSSASNPYVTITVDADGLNGHGGHGGDIIPAPAGGCPENVDTCSEAGLPCTNVPVLPAPALGLAAALLGIGGAAGARAVRRRRGDHLEDVQDDEADGRGDG